MNETSNLLLYTPNQLSLLVAGVDLKIKENRSFVKECRRWGKDFMTLHRDTIKGLNRDLEDLYALRIALITAHQAVSRKENMILN